jgi:hypothetical protein
MLQNPRGWNESLVRQTFRLHEAEEILCMRIPESEGKDILTWHFEKNGGKITILVYELLLEAQFHP